MRLTITTVLVASLLPISVHAVSFDCAKAKTYAEKEICGNSPLGKLDDALAANYQNMLSSNIGDGAKKDLKSTQKKWLSNRNKCTTSQCLIDMYRERVDAVCDYPVLSGVHPICESSEEIK